MALPTSRDVRVVDPVLTNLSLGFKNPRFFWDQIAPPVRVTEQTGTFFIYDRDYWFRRPGDEPGMHAPGTPYQRVGFGVSSDSYRADERGYEKSIADPTRAASQTPESLDTLATQFLTNLIQMELELDIAAAHFVTSVWGTSNTLTTTDRWSDYDGSDPIADADEAKRVIRRNTGEEPDFLFIGALTWEVLKEHPLILDKYKHTQTGILTEDLVAAALGISSMGVGKSVKNTGDEGAGFSGSDIWTDNALFLKRTVTPGLMVPNGAYTFIWDEAGNFPWAMQSYREEKVRSDIQRVFTHYETKIVASQFGYLHLDTNA